ncbi:C4-dicarboxylate ABC transporter permease [Sporosarcina sp. P18a]|uniref:TRAP transporter small permease n=1 Tax=Sporosarcina sp. P18a TaxID=2048259 RepID=UPI000C16F061|nr:TRAP transporter small permease [Sporosarcina sp. P18a]PIC80004.1 C4-dicarboxylate ABC transporter permease [Sporosarcina sp. P18a]
MRWKELIDIKMEEWLLIISTLFIVVLVFLQVLARYVFNISVGWSAELARYLLIWITWISMSYTIRKNDHIKITFLVDRLPVNVQKIVQVIVILLWSVFAFVMAIVGTQVVQTIKLMGQKTSTLDLPMWVVYLIIPIGGVLMLIRLVQRLYFIFKPEKIVVSGD